MKMNAVVLPPLRKDALGITLNFGSNIHKRYLRKRDGKWVVWTPKTKSGRYVWLESFTSEQLMVALASARKELKPCA